MILNIILRIWKSCMVLHTDILLLKNGEPELRGACITTCFPSTAPKQLGKFQIFQNSLLILFQSSSVGVGITLLNIFLIIASQTSFTIVHTVE